MANTRISNETFSLITVLSVVLLPLLALIGPSMLATAMQTHDTTAAAGAATADDRIRPGDLMFPAAQSVPVHRRMDAVFTVTDDDDGNKPGVATARIESEAGNFGVIPSARADHPAAPGRDYFPDRYTNQAREPAVPISTF